MASIEETGSNAFFRNGFIGWEEDFDWIDPKDMPQLTDTRDQVSKDKYDALRTAKQMLCWGLLGTVGLMGATEAVVHFDSPSDRPTFSATKIDGCYVSNDRIMVYPRNGIDDLIISNVQGVTSENGKGSECLRAAALVAQGWANNDGNRLNDITDLDVTNPYGMGSPIINGYAQYPVPQFATLKPQG